MKPIKSYCAILFIEYNGEYLCVDCYSNEVRCRGTYEECDAYYNAYVERIADRD